MNRTEKAIQNVMAGKTVEEAIIFAINNLKKTFAETLVMKAMFEMEEKEFSEMMKRVAIATA